MAAMDLKDILATNVRLIRQEHQITQEELAERTGISARYVGSIERARVSASVSILGKLAAALDVEPCALISARKN